MAFLLGKYRFWRVGGQLSAVGVKLTSGQAGSTRDDSFSLRDLSETS
jgi:hypothetical protein